MKKIWLFTLFTLYLCACSENSNSSEFQDESSSSYNNSAFCYDEYGFTKKNGWTKDISDSSYIIDYVCNHMSQHMRNMFSFYARCVSSSYNKSENRIDMKVSTESGYKYIWAELDGCKYKIGSDGDFKAWVAGLSEWSLDDCLCNEEDFATYYRKASPSPEDGSSSSHVPVEESSNSKSPDDESSSSLTQPPPSSSGGRIVCYESETESACIYVYDSSSSNGSIKPSSSTSEVNTSPYTYTYYGTGDLHQSSLTINITSDCINAKCFEDFESFDFENGTINSYNSGESAYGGSGRSIDIGNNQYTVLPWRLDKEIKNGSLDFFFKPNAKLLSSDNKTTALAGNDGARMSVFIYNGVLYFYKNIPNNPIFLSAEVDLKNEWIRITAEWNEANGVIALFLNGELIAQKDTYYGHYEPSSRGDYDNVFVLGYKSSCCMGSISDEMFAQGSFDNVQVVTHNIFEITE